MTQNKQKMQNQDLKIMQKAWEKSLKARFKTPFIERLKSFFFYCILILFGIFLIENPISLGIVGGTIVLILLILRK